MKKLKSLLVLSLAVIMAAGLCACGQKKTPTDVVNEYFTKIQNGDTELGDLLDMAYEASKGTTVDNGSLLDETKDILVDNCKKLTFTVNSEEVNGDTAKVNVTVNSMDLENIIKKAISNSLSYAFTQSFSGNKMNDEDTEKYLSELLNEYLRDTEFTDKTEDLTLTKDGDSWKIETDDALEKLVVGINSSGFEDIKK